ncbi:MAG TPA: hypothetical protein VK135_07565 [Candidatus Dormibacteraeota bacterium]|nr:hypothetical protein [Candidatus Dormibacteraeota bacterium]
MGLPYKILFIGIIAFLTTACSVNDDEPTQKGEPLENGSIAEEAYQVVKENNDAANNKDIDMFVNTYVERMQDTARKQVDKAFEETNFQHELSSPKVIEESEDHVALSVIQTTTDLTGENEKIVDVVEHELIKENGEFKIELSRPGECKRRSSLAYEPLLLFLIVR